jgi:uncharacterized protein
MFWSAALDLFTIESTGALAHPAAMQSFWRLPFLMAGLIACGGCQPTNPTGSSLATSAPPPAPMYHLDHAQPKLPTLKLWVGDQEIVAESALNSTQIATGMMFRKEMGTNEGMLFVFAQPHRVSFYMKNTVVPLSAAYIDPEGVILEIHDLKPLDETPVEAGSDSVQYVLEMNQGWFKRHNLGPGAVFRTDFGKLGDAFVRQR